MSKAFTRESDEPSGLPALPRLASPLPPGAKNYLTPGGERRLRDELNRLVQIDRPRILALAAGEDDDAKRQLQLLDQRILQTEESLRSAVVVPPTDQAPDVVRFGATVTVREPSGDLSRYRIVGVDETDIDHGWVSWLSPIAKALLNARTGQRVRFKRPAGEEELEIVGVAYDDEADSTSR
jgi:transcription elongation factor GreB